MLSKHNDVDKESGIMMITVLCYVMLQMEQ